VRLVGFGHSMGGASLLMAARRHPDLFAMLVLFEPIVLAAFPELSGVPSPLQIAARRRRPWFPSFDAAIANFAGKPPMNTFHPDALEAYVRGGLAPVADDDHDGPVKLLCTPDFEADTFATSIDHDTWDHLGEIATPTVVLAGTADDSTGPAMAAPLIAEQLPNGHYEEHAELDHFGPFTHPTDVAEIIRRAARSIT
jgi:pimeloyl-ACP methyl ester carboxylesterase